MGWTVFFCKKHTQAHSVNLRIGLGGEEETHTDWTTWNSGQPEELAVPEKYTDVEEIWIRGEAVPRGRNVHMCVRYNGKTTQKMTFDADEEHETSQGDEDDCDC